jgi:FdrA protein
MMDTKTSQGHVCLDMGEEEFTVGRAHPMIDPTLRQNRIIQEAEDATTAVILLDIVLGYGSHSDPGGALIPSIKEAKRICADRGGHLAVVASILGTFEDFQGYDDQKAKLEQEGVIVMPSNAQAARLSALIASRGELAKTLFDGDK